MSKWTLRKLGAIIVAAVAFESALICWLYYMRITHRDAVIWHSDVIVFVLPMVLCATVVAAALRRFSERTLSVGQNAFLSFGASCGGVLVALAIALNVWGS